MEKRLFYQGKCKKLYFGDFTKVIWGVVRHMNVCPVTEKNITIIMVSVCFVKKLTLEKKSLIVTHMPEWL